MEWYKVVLKDDKGNFTILDPMKLDSSQKIVDWAKLGSVTSNTLIHLLRQKPCQVVTVGDYLRIPNDNLLLDKYKTEAERLATNIWRNGHLGEFFNVEEIINISEQILFKLNDSQKQAWLSSNKNYAKPYKRKLSKEFAPNIFGNYQPSIFYMVSHTTKQYISFQRGTNRHKVLNPIIGMTIYGEYIPKEFVGYGYTSLWATHTLQILHKGDLPYNYRTTVGREFIFTD